MSLHMPRIPHGSPRYQEGYEEGYRKAVQDTKVDNDRLRARVAELEAQLGQTTLERDNLHLTLLELEAELRNEREACATIALEQRCERGTPWDTACTTIAAAIRDRAVLAKGREG